jgi:hypothetical protein
VLREILLAPDGNDREVSRTLRRYSLSPERVFNIVDGTDPLSFFFNSPINVDTLDGINRSMWSLGFAPTYNVELLASFLGVMFSGGATQSAEFKKNADTFWSSKGAFYRFLESESGIANVERSFQASVRRYIPKLTRAHFRMDDREFALRYPEVILETSTDDAVEDIRPHQEFVVNSAIGQIDRNSVFARYVRKRSLDTGSRERLPQHPKG